MFRSPYNFDSDVSSELTALDVSDSFDRTQQSFKDECDINTLVKVYARTGVVPGADLPVMQFEVDEIIDYQTALNRIIEADSTFMSLPATVRDRFQNDPGRLLDFVHDEANREEAEALGLVKPKPVSEPPQPVNTGIPTPAAPLSDS